MDLTGRLGGRSFSFAICGFCTEEPIRVIYFTHKLSTVLHTESAECLQQVPVQCETNHTATDATVITPDGQSSTATGNENLPGWVSFSNFLPLSDSLLELIATCDQMKHAVTLTEGFIWFKHLWEPLDNISNSSQQIIKQKSVGFKALIQKCLTCC